nr:G protein-coupled receptor [Proales similis]
MSRSSVGRCVTAFLVFFLLTGRCLAQNDAHQIEEEEEALNQRIMDEKKAVMMENIDKNSEECKRPAENGAEIDQSAPKCPKLFDRILCWPETAAGKWAYQECPHWFIGFENAHGVAKRYCESDGTWQTKSGMNGSSYTDYKDCVKDVDRDILDRHLKTLKLIGKIGSSMSLFSLISAILLLLMLKRLHCARNILHVNLFASFLLFCISHLIKETFWVYSVGFPKDVILEPGLKKVMMNENVSHWECKTLMSIHRYAESSNHVMVFCEALYLNTLVSISTFNEKNNYKLYIAAGWLAPLIWIVPFIVSMAIWGNPNSCWNTQTMFSYLYVVPQVLLITLDFVLFIIIFWVLRNKLKKSNFVDPRHHRYRVKLAKSTLILLPLFSTYYIAFSVWQPFVSSKLPISIELVRLYFEIICSSFQGFLIALIYVFFNSEVRDELLRQIDRKILQHNPNMARLGSFVNRGRNRSSVSTNIRDRTNLKRRETQKEGEITPLAVGDPGEADSVYMQAKNQQSEENACEHGRVERADSNSAEAQTKEPLTRPESGEPAALDQTNENQRSPSTRLPDHKSDPTEQHRLLSPKP